MATAKVWVNTTSFPTKLPGSSSLQNISYTMIVVGVIQYQRQKMPETKNTGQPGILSVVELGEVLDLVVLWVPHEQF